MTGQIQLLLGDNPFNGVDHLSQERLRARMSLGIDDIAGIISTAVDNGATGFTFSTTPKMLEVLRAMKNHGISKKFDLFPVIPDVGAYFQLVAEKGMLGAMLGKLGGLSAPSKVQSVFGGGLALLSQSPTRILRAYAGTETSLVQTALPIGARIRSLFLHEIGTDLLVSLEMTDLFEAYVQAVRDNLKVVPGFVTRNFPRFIDFIQKCDFDLRDYFVLTPFNSMGFQMNPSKDDCERTLTNANGASVIAMSILAGGHLNLNEALEYIHRLPTRISVAVGVSTARHAQETFYTLKERLQV